MSPEIEERFTSLDNAQKRHRESTDEFCKRLGIIQHKGEKGGVEFAPYHGGNLSHKKPKRSPSSQHGK